MWSSSNVGACWWTRHVAPHRKRFGASKGTAVFVSIRWLTVLLMRQGKGVKIGASTPCFRPAVGHVQYQEQSGLMDFHIVHSISGGQAGFWFEVARCSYPKSVDSHKKRTAKAHLSR